jgi:hypothetical protein
VVALHGLEPGEDVLEDAGLDVVDAGHAVGGGRALVEDPAGAVGVALQRAFEDLAVPPALQEVAFEGRKINLRGE